MAFEQHPAHTPPSAETLAQLNQAVAIIDAVAGALGVIEQIITLGR